MVIFGMCSFHLCHKKGYKVEYIGRCMGNRNRLIISLVLLFVSWFSISVFSGTLVGILFLGLGFWSLIEGVVFVKAKGNHDALPLALMAIFIALYALFVGIGSITTSALDLVEGGIFQSIGFLLFIVVALVFPILGIWAIIKGIILIRNKENVRLGVISLIIGAIVTIPALIFLITMLVSVVGA